MPRKGEQPPICVPHNKAIRVAALVEIILTINDNIVALLNRFTDRFITHLADLQQVEIAGVGGLMGEEDTLRRLAVGDDHYTFPSAILNVFALCPRQNRAGQCARRR